MKKNRIRRIVSFFMSFLMLIGLSTYVTASEKSVSDPSTVLPDAITEPHKYPVIPGSREWSTLTDTESKLAACYVDPDKMERMTTDALVETVLNYPLLCNIYAYGSVDAGIEAVSTYFPGLKELFSRPDAVEVLSEKREKLLRADTEGMYFLREGFTDWADYAKPISSEAECVLYEMQTGSLIDYINTSIAKDSEASDMLRYIDFVDIYTPMGTKVRTITGFDWSDHDGTTYARQAV